MIVKVSGEFSVSRKFDTIVEVNFDVDPDSCMTTEEQLDHKIQEAVEINKFIKNFFHSFPFRFSLKFNIEVYIIFLGKIQYLTLKR